MTGSGRRWLARVLLLLLLIAVVASAVYYFAFRTTHEAVAELRVHPFRSLDIAADSLSAGDQMAELEQFAATCAELIYSRGVLRKALRDDEVRKLKLIQDCEDPEGWLSDAIEVRRPTPAVIEIVMAAGSRRDCDECVTLVDAVTTQFVQETAHSEHDSLQNTKSKLEAIYQGLLEEEMRARAEIEDMASVLGASPPERTPAVALHPALVRKTEKMIDALAEEIARIRVALLVEDEVDEEKQAQKLKRLEQEYALQTAELEDLLTKQAEKAQPKSIFTIEMKQRELARLEQQIDRIAELLFQTEMQLESRGRIELISPAVAAER